MFIQYFGILFLTIVVLSYFAKLLKQPIILGYIVSGILFSVFLSNDIVMAGQIKFMAEIGITFLLFLMGLEFDLKSMKFLGKDVFFSTFLQTIVFFIFGFLIVNFFPLGIKEKIYLTILFLFTSTLLIVKWLEDKKEISTLHGKLILGITIMQDIFAIIAITALELLKESSFLKLIMIPIEGIILFLIAFILSKYILNYFLKFASKFPELLFIFSLGICFFFVLISPYFGYSSTIGAFIAGVTIANTIYKNDISSKLKPLINFFNMLFFVGLGFQMDFFLRKEYFILIGIFVLASLTLKPFLTYLTLRYRGYDRKTSFISGINLTPASEFGIIIIAGGIISGVINKEIGSISIITVILSMMISSYIIKYDKKIYEIFKPLICRIDKKKLKKSLNEEEIVNCNILFIGYYELGKEIYEKLKNMNKRILVIENNPQNIEILEKEKIPYVYNSISNPEFFEHIPFEKIELVISSLIDIQDNLMIIKKLKSKNPNATAIVNAKSLKDSLELYNHSADYVIYPRYINEQQVSVLLDDYTTDINKVLSKKIEDIAKLKDKENKYVNERENRSRLFEIDKFMSRLNRKKQNNEKTKSKKK
jgi:Kef-type K+ transport system membrane component KefB/Trk K+ transport system NAD-binding subunit